VKTKSLVIDNNKNIYRDFAKKQYVSGANLTEGALTGSYTFIDKDPALVYGATYYYRVRAVFGMPSQYLSVGSPSDLVSKKGTLLFPVGNQWVFRPDAGVTLGKASNPIKGVVPIPTSSTNAFNSYENVFDAIQAGILLNFDFPPASKTDTVMQQSQKTGWGTLNMLGGQTGALKAAYPSSDQLIGNFLFNSTTRRLANQILDKLIAQPSLNNQLSTLWLKSVSVTVNLVLNNPTVKWKLIGIVGGINNLTTNSVQQINNYLALESTYVAGQPYTGPLPISSSLPGSITVAQRQDLASFLQIALSLLSHQVSYLSWYSMTVGDLFPSLMAFLNNLQQFILALLKALQTAMAKIAEIIQTLLSKITALEQIVQQIINIINMLQIDITLGVFVTSTGSGGAPQLAADLQSSTNQPSSEPFSLYSGIVITAGGPGVGIIDGLKFLMGMG
jgi:hypothetical protein